MNGLMWDGTDLSLVLAGCCGPKQSLRGNKLIAPEMPVVPGLMGFIIQIVCCFGWDLVVWFCDLDRPHLCYHRRLPHYETQAQLDSHTQPPPRHAQPTVHRARGPKSSTLSIDELRISKARAHMHDGPQFRASHLWRRRDIAIASGHRALCWCIPPVHLRL